MSDPAFTDGSTAAWEPGVVVGIRRWRVSATGQLLPLTLDGVPWRPGVNTAGCASGDSYRNHFRATETGYVRTKAADPRCRCGFYAFHRLDRWRWNRCPEPLVEGVIAAHGNATIGRRGFRAEKARVVALCIPPGAGTRDDLCRALRIPHTGVIWSALLAATGLALTAFGTHLADVGGWPAAVSGFLIWLAGVAAAAFAMLTCVFGMPWGNGVHRGPGTWPDVLRENWPDVPIYRTRAAMLADHPLSGPPADADRNIPPTRKEPA